jgi:hypothetical protein
MGTSCQAGKRKPGVGWLGPWECGENIRVETQPSRSDKGLISVSVTFTPTAPEPSRGRVKAFGKFVVKNGDETIAVSNLESTQKAGVFRYVCCQRERCEIFSGGGRVGLRLRG